MIVFNNFFKIIKTNITVILLYAVIFIGFGIFTSSMGGSSSEFVPVKVNVAVINNSSSELAKAFIKYVDANTLIKDIKEKDIDDSLFYREIEYVFYLDENFSLGSKINTKKIPGSTSSIYVEMLLNRYLNLVATYVDNGISEEDALKLINNDLVTDSEVSIVSESVSKTKMASFYFSFSNYTIIAISLFVISTIIMAFRNENVDKRNKVSSTPYKEINRQLFMASSLLSLLLFLIISIMSLIFFGSTMISMFGILILLNLLVFIFTIQSFSLFIAKFIKNKDSLTGVVNVVALGSSFISGAFVPQFMLGSVVITIAHIFPSYYFISNNNILSNLTNFNLSNLGEYFMNILIVIVFGIAFYFLNNYKSKKEV